MRYVIAMLPLIGVALGVLAIIGGGYDDAPGLQLIGALLILGAVVIAMRTARRAELYDEASSVDRQEAARHSAGCFDLDGPGQLDAESSGRFARRGLAR